MNEISMEYWKRPIAERPPRNPLPAFEGDDTTETLLNALEAQRQSFFDETKQFVNDPLGFTNFMRKQYLQPPLIQVEPSNATLYRQLSEAYAKATAAEDWLAAVAAEEEMELMSYIEDPAYNETKEEEEWYLRERIKKEGSSAGAADFWENLPLDEMLQVVDRENAEYIEKLARLGEVYNNQTGRFVRKVLPFTPSSGALFDSSLVGGDLEIENTGKTVTRAFTGRPTYALWGRGGRVAADTGDTAGVSRWKIRVDSNIGLMSIGVMELPFAPTQGLARKLATRAWFVNSAGEAIRTGPSTLTDNHEYVEKDNMTWMHADSKVWEEGSTLNPKYRKPKCDMIVDPQTGETVWLESDRLRDEALSYQGSTMMQQLTDSLALRLMLQLGPEMVQVGSERFLKIEKRRASESRRAAESWDKESWEECFNRSVADGFWAQVCAEHPLPDLSALGYRNYTGNLQGLLQETQALVTEEAVQVAEEWGIPKHYCYEQRELCKVERLAYMDVLKFGPLWYADLMTDAEASEVRLEFNRRAGTLLVRIDNRPESFLFRNVSKDAKPFVNLCAVAESVTILDE